MQTDPPSSGRQAGGAATAAQLVEAIVRAGNPIPFKNHLLQLPVQAVLEILSTAAPRIPQQPAVQRYAREVIRVPEAELNTWYAQAWWGTYASAACENRSVLPGREQEVLALVHPVDWSLLDAQLAKGRGVMICGAHWGTSHINTMLLTNAGRPIAQVARWLSLQRNPEATRIDGKLPTFMQLYLRAFHHLRAGGIVSIGPDGRHWRESIGERFFGHPCRVSLAAAAMARLAGAPSLFSMAVWEESRVRVHHTLAPPPEPDGGEAADRLWMRGYLDWLEGMIRAHPRIVRFDHLLPRVTPQPEPARVD